MWTNRFPIFSNRWPYLFLFTACLFLAMFSFVIGWAAYAYLMTVT